MINVAQYEIKLRERLTYLEAQLHKIEDQLDVPPNRDWADNAAEHEDDEVLEDIGNMDQHEIRAINAALGRVKAGTYGLCVTCEDEISTARLSAVPHTPFCKNCMPG